MPILKDFRVTKKITLPSFEGSEVEIYDSVLVRDISRVDVKDSTDLEQVIQYLHLFIKSWNFTNEEGQDLPVTKENLDFLKMDDVTKLGEEIVKFSEETKKNQIPCRISN